MNPADRFAHLRTMHTGDTFEIPGLSGRPGDIAVVLVAETPGFLGTAILLRPGAGQLASLDDRRVMASKLATMLRTIAPDGISPIPAFAPSPGPWGVEPQVLRPDGHLVHFLAAPEARGNFNPSSRVRKDVL
jgi:hypothetical protein